MTLTLACSPDEVIGISVLSYSATIAIHSSLTQLLLVMSRCDNGMK